jgi:cytochrome b subunit of formate dehydrogenase
MNYSEIIKFEPAEFPLRLQAAVDPDAAVSLIDNLVVSDELASYLAHVVFHYLSGDQAAQDTGLLVVGPPSSGKTHVIAAASSIAEYIGLADRLPHPQAVQAALPVAGRFKVVRTRLQDNATDLRTHVCLCLAEALPTLAPLGLVPVEARLANPEDFLADLLAEFQRVFPGLGLLLVVDDLEEYVCGASSRAIAKDLAFLRQIGQVNPRLRFRFIAGLRYLQAGDDRTLAVEGFIRQAIDCFVQVPLTPQHAASVVIDRVLKKTVAQRELVRDHLLRFATCYPELASRIEEFINCYPIHPDCLPMMGQFDRNGRWQAVPAVSHVLRRLWPQPIPNDGPGIVSSDEFWAGLLQDPAYASEAEFEAVRHSVKKLETRALQSIVLPQHQMLAFRLIHFLGIHRLTAPDVYTRSGLTSEQLRDLLCVPPAWAGKHAATSPARLSDLIATVLSKLGAGEEGRGRLLAFDEATQQYYLHYPRFRRFVVPELILHWANAVPFVLLMLSGGTMIAARFLNLDPVWMQFARDFHKTTGVTWLIFMPLAILTRPKVHWRHLRLIVRWGKEDLIWMLQTLRGMQEKDAHMSPAGRFNTGQKINACLVALYFIGFGATGLLMWSRGTMLFPWYIHTSLFFASLGSVGGHLFLATVNPSTRIALGGIFHGWAPFEYVEHHHALSGPKEMRAHLAHTGTPALLVELLGASKALLRIAVVLVLAGGLVIFLTHRKMDTIKANFAKSFSDAIQPSKLTMKHRMAKTAESCTKCHSYTGEISRSKCEACHDYIRDRRERMVGYHGTFSSECTTCHHEHPSQETTLVRLARDNFDHSMAAFKREGKHAEVACDECHRNKRTPDMPGVYFTGLRFNSCTDCHSDRHSGQFAVACEQCHTPEGWYREQLKFKHATHADFQLEGKHQALRCEACHKPRVPSGKLASAAFRGLDTHCLSCHQEPHRQQLGQQCTSCHSTKGWTGQFLSFDHDNRTKFPLVEKHAQARCPQCHKPNSPAESLGHATFRGLKSACADCHQDPHRGQMQRGCAECHPSPTSWKLDRQLFVHNRDTQFTLLGRHTSVDCIKCHSNPAAGERLGFGQFRGLAKDCAGCHKVQHPPEYGNACLSCHQMESWPKKKPGMEHIFNLQVHKENLSGKHLSAKCVSCHDGQKVPSPQAAKGMTFECITCHKGDDRHDPTLGSDCQKCHQVLGWKGEDLRFDHARMSRFVMDQDHRKLACNKCHEANRWKPLDPKCESCHGQDFLNRREKL